MQQRERQLASRQTLIHTYEVLDNLHEVQNLLDDAETGQRGYLLTGNERYLQPFKRAEQSLQITFEKLRTLLVGAQAQQHRLGELTALSNEKIDELKETITLRKSKSFEAALDVVKSDRGQHYMELIRTNIKMMRTAEQKLLAQRSLILDAETNEGWQSLVNLLILSMFALIMVSWILYKFFVDRQKAESDTAEQKKLLQTMLDTMSDGVIIANTSGKFAIWNPAAIELFGNLIDIPTEKWTEHFGLFEADMKTLIPPEEVPLTKALAGHNVDDREIYVKSISRPAGRWVLVTARPLESEGTDFRGAMVVCRDITERKEVEKRVSEFYSTISHELRTPLTSIRASLGLIEGGIGGDVSEKALKLVKIGRIASDRLIRLINDILDISKIEAGKFELVRRNVEAERLVQRALEGIEGMAQEKEVKVVSEIKTRGPIECDEDRIIQVLTNLLSNAIKFSPENSTVKLLLQPGRQGFFRFSIIDSGPGIAPDQMHKLFGKFQQLDSSDSRKAEGTGLGLAITKALVEQHGGKIVVESEVGKGSEFYVELPANFNPQLIELEPKVKRSKHPALIVEDDQTIAQLLREHLVADGFSVIIATTIAEAEEVLKDTVPLVIILDLNLPDGSGIAFFQKLSLSEKHFKVPVIVVTGSDRGDQLYSEPALIDWISKPFDEKKLHEALNCARERMGRARVLVVEDDSTTRELIRNQIEALGAECIEAEDGAKALTSIREDDPDLVILDLSIPAPDGYAVIDILKSETRSLKPLIVYTALDLNEEQKQKLHLGLTAHLTKSRTSQEELVGTVKEFLNGLLLGKDPRPQAPEIISSDDTQHGEQ